MSEFMTIQTFSKRTGISKSALRYYESENLLHPIRCKLSLYFGTKEPFFCTFLQKALSPFLKECAKFFVNYFGRENPSVHRRGRRTWFNFMTLALTSKRMQSVEKKTTSLFWKSVRIAGPSARCTATVTMSETHWPHMVIIAFGLSGIAVGNAWRRWVCCLPFSSRIFSIRCPPYGKSWKSSWDWPRGRTGLRFSRQRTASSFMSDGSTETYQAFIAFLRGGGGS